MKPEPKPVEATLTTDDLKPVFDKGFDHLPWGPDDALPIDEDGNILPGNDNLDEDPNDNGDLEQFDPTDRRLPPI